MQRIRVDLPEPDGPQTTTRSPVATCMLTSRRTCSAPNHLLTLSSTIAGGASVRMAEATCVSVIVSLIAEVPCLSRPGVYLRRCLFRSRSRSWLYLLIAKQKTR
jgi:hypothetical protein